MEYLFIVALAAMLLALCMRQQALQQRVRRLEERLDNLADSTAHKEYKTDYISEKLQNEIGQLKRDGQTVQAVKRLREQTGLDLMQAKRIVDRL